MNKRERQEYILDVRDWIAAGASKTNVIRKFRQQNMPERVAANIYDQAVALIQKEYAQDNQKIKDLISYRYDDLYEKAYDQKKYGVCAQILKEQSELQGLKVTNINANLNGDFNGDALIELTNQLNVILVTMQKGNVDVIKDLIEQGRDDEGNPDSDQEVIRTELDAANPESNPVHTE